MLYIPSWLENGLPIFTVSEGGQKTVFVIGSQKTVPSLGSLWESSSRHLPSRKKNEKINFGYSSITTKCSHNAKYFDLRLHLGKNNQPKISLIGYSFRGPFMRYITSVLIFKALSLLPASLGVIQKWRHTSRVKGGCHLCDTLYEGLCKAGILVWPRGKGGQKIFIFAWRH